MRLRKAHLNFLLEGTALLSLALLASTGVMLAFVLPPGSQGGRGLALLGMTRHEWGDIHFYISLAFLLLMIVHLVLHWRWVWAMAKGPNARYQKARGAGFLLATAFFILLILLPFLLPVQSGVSEAGHDDEVEHREGRGWRGGRQ